MNPIINDPFVDSPLWFNTGDVFQYTNLDDGHTYEVEILVSTPVLIAYESRGPLAPPLRGITEIPWARKVLDDLGATRIL